MKLSVIVPVYNMASQNKLSYCMDSLVRQTHKDLEILAVDDCSTDESYAILKEYERRFPGRVRAFQSEVNHHQGGAKNIGLSHADGDWIGFIDADDWVVRTSMKGCCGRRWKQERTAWERTTASCTAIR